MAHDTTHIFVDRTVTPNIGISLADIAYVLGTGADMGRASAIKKWAKYKPLPVGDQRGYTDAQAKKCNYGLYVPYYTNLGTMIQDITAGTWARATNYIQGKAPFDYTLATWSRVLDFDGYNHAEKPAVTPIVADKSSYTPEENPTFSTITNGGDSDMVRPQDLRAVNNDTILAENMYYGVVERVAGEPLSYRVLGRASTLGTGQVNIQTTGMYFPRVGATQTVIICLFLCDTYINNGETSSDTNKTGYFIPLVPSRASLDLMFDALALESVTTAQWFTADYRNIIYGIRCFPNTGIYGRGVLEIYGGPDSTSYDTLLLSSSFDLYLEKIIEASTQLQNPTGIRIVTDRDNAQIIVNVYTCERSVTAQDIVDGSNLPAPSQTVTVPFTGEMTDPDYVLQMINERTLTFTLNTDSSFPSTTNITQTIVL